MCNLKYKSNEQGFLENTEKGIFLLQYLPPQVFSLWRRHNRTPRRDSKKENVQEKISIQSHSARKGSRGLPATLARLATTVFLATLVT